MTGTIEQSHFSLAGTTDGVSANDLSELSTKHERLDEALLAKSLPLHRPDRQLPQEDATPDELEAIERAKREMGDPVDWEDLKRELEL